MPHSRIWILLRTGPSFICLNKAVNQSQLFKQKSFPIVDLLLVLYCADATNNDFNKSFIGLSPEISNKQM